ncbi:MAG: PRC-barrel domain-containing protein [Anaerolineae bacterium]|nr:PRC-barrel domain-containing protein [Anaerolineae bacterium]
MDRLKTDSTMNMQFKQGTHVYTSDNQDVGTIDRIVLDPRSDEVNALVVRKGWLFTEDKVVPIDMVETATDEQVTLRQTEAALENLPEYEETYYIPTDERDYGKDRYADSLYMYPPIGTAWWGYGSYIGAPAYVPQPDYVERRQQNIPAGTVAVKQGARIVSSDGEHVGNVEEVFTDAATNQATHIVISQGLLFKDRKLIPTNWIRLTGEDEIILTVNTRLVDSLPEYAG